MELERGKWTPEIYRAIRLFDPDLTCSFNSFLSMSGLYPWDVMQLPHLAMLLDPVFYSADFVRSPYAMLSSVDRQDCRWLVDNQFRRIFFWPHAVEKMEERKPEERPFDVVFLGTFTDFEAFKLRWQRELPEPQVKVLFEASAQVLSDNRTSLTQALAESFAASQLNSQGVDFKQLFYFLDNYTRGKDRFELVHSIKDAQVHVFGEPSWNNPIEGVNWNTYLSRAPNVHIHPPVSYTESFDVLRKSKICLNSMPFFKYGSHERIFNALACGALPLTMDNLYVREAFDVGQELLTYMPGKWSLVNELVNTYLSNENLRAEMAAKGFQKVMRQHTWDQRVKELFEIVPNLLLSILPPD